MKTQTQTQTDKQHHFVDKEMLQRLVVGALRDAINAHGPVDRTRIGSAAKRITGSLHRTLCTLE